MISGYSHPPTLLSFPSALSHVPDPVPHLFVCVLPLEASTPPKTPPPRVLVTGNPRSSGAPLQPHLIYGSHQSLAVPADHLAIARSTMVVYTNNPIVVENSINTSEQLLVEDEKYKVVDFNLEYTYDRVGNNALRAFREVCRQPDYKFATVGTTNNLKVLKTSGLSRQKLVDIQRQYRVRGLKKDKDSLVDLITGIIDPYYRDMKAECDKEDSVWHKAWVNKLDEVHIKYGTKAAYTSYKIYVRIVDMRKCLLLEGIEG
ncbi:hypothetical protein D1007_17012 [Hordeum vulgare]|nr:hypothetical protein D1007_17012 [Hordeum vulgare]